MDSFTFDHIIISPDRQIGLHQQETWELSYIVRGEGTRTIGDKTENFGAGDLVLVVPEMPHVWRFRRPRPGGGISGHRPGPEPAEPDYAIENISLAFSQDLLSRIGSDFAELGEMASWYAGLRHSVFIPGAEGRAIGGLLMKMTEETGAERLLSFLKVLMEIWDADGKRDSGDFGAGKDDSVVSQVQNYIHCNFKRRITIGQLSAYAGINGTSLCTLFKEKTGKTIIQYVMDLRMDMVKNLLRNSEMSISEVCYDCGFRNVPYFNRTFKRLLGMSPKQYRLAAQSPTADR